MRIDYSSILTPKCVDIWFILLMITSSSEWIHFLLSKSNIFNYLMKNLYFVCGGTKMYDFPYILYLEPPIILEKYDQWLNSMNRSSIHTLSLNVTVWQYMHDSSLKQVYDYFLS